MEDTEEKLPQQHIIVGGTLLSAPIDMLDSEIGRSLDSLDSKSPRYGRSSLEKIKEIKAPYGTLDSKGRIAKLKR